MNLVASVSLVVTANLLLVLPAGAAAAVAQPRLEVAAGCAAPAAMPTGRAFFVDPVHGSADGDGSSARPWKSLNAIISDGFVSTMPRHYDSARRAMVSPLPNAPIHPGDVIFLRSGEYGTVTIQGYYGHPNAPIGYDNTDFITVMPAPGANPIINRLRILGAGKWVFQKLMFRNPEVSPADAPREPIVKLTGPAHDIIFDDNTIMSQPSVEGWDRNDWLAKISVGLEVYAGTYDGVNCATITNNSLKYVGDSIKVQRANHVLIDGNRINYFIHDGIDYGSNNMLIRHNVITNRVDAGDIAILHPDLMQGQPWGSGHGDGGDHLENVVIDGNIAIRQTDPDLPLAREASPETPTQGIDTFDGTWTNLKIINNVVVTNTWQGISYYGVHGIVIANNTLLDDNSSQRMIPRIVVHASKTSVASTGIVIENNIASGYAIDDASVSGIVAFDHNLCAPSKSKCLLQLGSSGKWNFGPGSSADNKIATVPPEAIFAVFDTTTKKYDLHLKGGSDAVGTGARTDNTPDYDIAGSPRKGPPDLGAYVYRAGD